MHEHTVAVTLSLIDSVPRDILVDAVKAGLRLVFAVAGQVEGKDAKSGGRLRRGSWDLDVLRRGRTGEIYRF